MNLSDKERADFIADCTRAAAFYSDKPGLAGPRAIVDLYNALARFAALTDPQRSAKPAAGKAK
jgi:hypothetical protein